MCCCSCCLPYCLLSSNQSAWEEEKQGRRWLERWPWNISHLPKCKTMGTWTEDMSDNLAWPPSWGCLTFHKWLLIRLMPRRAKMRSRVITCYPPADSVSHGCTPLILASGNSWWKVCSSMCHWELRPQFSCVKHRNGGDHVSQVGGQEHRNVQRLGKEDGQVPYQTNKLKWPKPDVPRQGQSGKLTRHRQTDWKAQDKIRTAHNWIKTSLLFLLIWPLLHRDKQSNTKANRQWWRGYERRCPRCWWPQVGSTSPRCSGPVEHHEEVVWQFFRKTEFGQYRLWGFVHLCSHDITHLLVNTSKGWFASCTIFITTWRETLWLVENAHVDFCSRRSINHQWTHDNEILDTASQLASPSAIGS